MNSRIDAIANERLTAHVSLGNAQGRARVVDALHRQGIRVFEQPSGFHLLQAIADVIEGRVEKLPALLVVDALARGCSGLTIANGLRDLGVRIPLVLVTKPGDPRPASDDPLLRIAAPHDVLGAIAELLGAQAKREPVPGPGSRVDGGELAHHRNEDGSSA